MSYEITQEEATKARHPHELFLINLIFNHVFLFIAAISATSLQQSVIAVPVISVGILGYTLWRARRSPGRDPWFVTCHWQVAAKRSLLFMAMLGVGLAMVLLLLAVSGGNPGPQHYALGGVVFFPAMLTMLILILMESEAMQQAGHGKLPKWATTRCPAEAQEASGA